MSEPFTNPPIMPGFNYPMARGRNYSSLVLNAAANLGTSNHLGNEQNRPTGTGTGMTPLMLASMPVLGMSSQDAVSSQDETKATKAKVIRNKGTVSKEDRAKAAKRTAQAQREAEKEGGNKKNNPNPKFNIYDYMPDGVIKSTWRRDVREARTGEPTYKKTKTSYKTSESKRQSVSKYKKKMKEGKVEKAAEDKRKQMLEECNADEDASVHSF